MDNSNSSNTNTSGISKGRRVLGSDPSLVKLHDIQLKEVAKSLRHAGYKEKGRSKSRSRSRSSEREPPRPHHQSLSKIKKELIRARMTQSVHQQSLPVPTQKPNADHPSTTFLNELNLYMKQAKCGETADCSESDSAGSLKHPYIDEKNSDLEMQPNESRFSVKKAESSKRVGSPPLSDISDENSSGSSTTSQSESEESDDDYSDKAQRVQAKSKAKMNTLSVSTMVPKVDSTILKNVSASNIDRNQMNKYLTECEGSQGSILSESASSGSHDMQNRALSCYGHRSCTAIRQMNPTVNVPELTKMVQQIPKILTFDKNLPVLKKSSSSYQTERKAICSAPSCTSDIKTKSSDHRTWPVGNSSSKQFRFQLVEAHSNTSKHGSTKSRCDRTTIKISHLSPEEMPSAMLKSMVEGVVAVTEPEFEPHSTLRFPTKSLYVLFKSEDAADKAMAYLKDANIQCEYRTIE